MRPAAASRRHGFAVRRTAVGLLVALAWLSIASAPAAAAVGPEEPDYEPDAPGRPGLSIGITEFNPNLIWPAEVRTPPLGFEHWRDQLAAIRPRYFRLMIDWRQLQPSPDAPANLDIAQAGCVHGIGPCLGWNGLREVLQALAAAQSSGGWETLAVITGTPDWAASAPHGCERPTEQPRSRPPRADALGAYRQLVLDVLAAARQAGAEIRWWSAWNEPNHPFFSSPQRERCDVASPTLGPASYVPLVRALDQALDDAPGDQRRVAGELAASLNGSELTTSIGEFIAGLPRDVVCGSQVWTMHAYVPANPRTDALAATNRALHAHGCERRHAIWATETGLGTALAGRPDEEVPPQDRPDACRRLHDWMLKWHRHPHGTAVFQYTFRQDPLFRVGLITSAMDRAFTTLRVWQAWGSRPLPDSPPPSEEEACGVTEESG